MPDSESGVIRWLVSFDADANNNLAELNVCINIRRCEFMGTAGLWSWYASYCRFSYTHPPTHKIQTALEGDLMSSHQIVQNHILFSSARHRSEINMRYQMCQDFRLRRLGFNFDARVHLNTTWISFADWNPSGLTGPGHLCHVS